VVLTGRFGSTMAALPRLILAMSLPAFFSALVVLAVTPGSGIA